MNCLKGGGGGECNVRSDEFRPLHAQQCKPLFIPQNQLSIPILPSAAAAQYCYLTTGSETLLLLKVKIIETRVHLEAVKTAEKKV